MTGFIKRTARGLLRLLGVVAVLALLVLLVNQAAVEPSKAPAGSSTTYDPPDCEGSSTLTDAADAIVEAGDSTRYPAAKRLYQQVIRQGSDGDRACATTGLAQLLEQEEQEADAAAAKAGWENKLKAAWSSWTKAHIDPLKDALLVAVGLFVLLLVLARLAASVLVRPNARAPGDLLRRAWLYTGLLLMAAASVSAAVSSRASVDRGWLWPVAFGVVLVVLVVLLEPWDDNSWQRTALSMGVTTLVAGVLVIPGLGLDVLLVAGAWAGVTGLVLVALARGVALAVEVLVRGSSGDNPTRARLLVARIQDLGAVPPDDIRFLGASDVTSLPEDALTTVPTGTWATAVFNVLKVVRPAAPWRVTVSQPDDATLVVEITRNRVTVPGAFLTLNVDDLPKPLDVAISADAEAGKSEQKKEDAKGRDVDELMTIAAAHTLLMLSEPHAPLRIGLCGATHWKALAFQAISARPTTPAERKKVLLHAAVDASPQYLLARMAVADLIDDGDEAGRQKWAFALEKLWKDFRKDVAPEDVLNDVVEGYEAAQLRLLFNRAVAWANVRTDGAMKADDSARGAWQASAKAAIDLNDRLVKLEKKPPRGLQRLVQESFRSAVFVLLDLAQHVPQGEADHKADVEERAAKWRPELEGKLLPETRNDYYGRACYYAGSDGEEGQWPKALDSLAVAGSDARLSAWAPKDPSLAVFSMSNEKGKRASDEQVTRFKALLTPAPPSSYLELPLFKAYAAALKAYGLTEISDLAAVSHADLASTAKVHPSVAQRWIDAADLEAYLCQRGEDDEAARLQLLDVLLAADVTDRQGLLIRLDGDQAALARFYVELVTKAASKRIVPTWDQTIKRWKEVDPPDGLWSRET